MVERDQASAEASCAEQVDPARPAASSAQIAPDAAQKAELGAEDEALFRRRLRVGMRRGPLLSGIAALVVAVVSAFVMFRHPRSSSLSLVGQDTPEWLAEDRLGERAKKATSNRFGLEGPAANEDPHMAREEAKKMAQAAGIIGVLKSSTGAWSRGPHQEPPLAADRMNALGNDPMSALGALMSDEVGANAGAGRLGLRGTGRGAGSKAEGTIGLGRIGTIGHGAGGAAYAAPGASRPTARSEPTVVIKPLDDQRDAKRERVRPAAGRPKPTPETSRTPPRYTASPARPEQQAVARSERAPRPASISNDQQVSRAPVANAAPAWLARHTTLAGVQFQDPNGYFENTYVPGDPVMRALQARLTAHDRALVLPVSARNARLDDAVQRNAQPFDAPVNAALGLYLSASERGLTGERRMLVQVGLQATPRYGGRRPAMNVGIVLDVRGGLDAQASASVRALLTAFVAARDLSDRFSLFAVGQAAGPVVMPEAFRNGPLSVALQRLLEAPVAPQASMTQAVQQAIAAVRGSDDPAAPLGSSEVIVVTARRLDAELPELLVLAQQSAIDGVPLSVFGVGSTVDVGELSRLALAGQGNRRLLGSASEAEPAVDRELSSVARAVARAVRLRIRLAQGVRLVSVLGSKRLDQPKAEQVRAAENSIDQRLSRNLGIASDRGEDEEGIQIVIPTLYAGDSHVVLLDVVAAGPGPIADVTVRYKDLAQLGNGIARDRLALPNLELARGALERNVLKNLIAFELSQALQQAGDAVAAGSSQDAARILTGASTLLEQLDRELPGLGGDRELASDRALTAEYSGLLPVLERAEQRTFLADSLHFASLLKLQPRPDWEGRIR